MKIETKRKLLIVNFIKKILENSELFYNEFNINYFYFLSKRSNA